MTSLDILLKTMQNTALFYQSGMNTSKTQELRDQIAAEKAALVSLSPNGKAAKEAKARIAQLNRQIKSHIKSQQGGTNRAIWLALGAVVLLGGGVVYKVSTEMQPEHAVAQTPDSADQLLAKLEAAVSFVEKKAIDAVSQEFEALYGHVPGAQKILDTSPSERSRIGVKLMATDLARNYTPAAVGKWLQQFETKKTQLGKLSFLSDYYTVLFRSQLMGQEVAAMLNPLYKKIQHHAVPRLAGSEDLPLKDQSFYISLLTSYGVELSPKQEWHITTDIPYVEGGTLHLPVLDEKEDPSNIKQHGVQAAYFVLQGVNSEQVDLGIDKAIFRNIGFDPSYPVDDIDDLEEAFNKGPSTDLSAKATSRIILSLAKSALVDEDLYPTAKLKARRIAGFAYMLAVHLQRRGNITNDVVLSALDSIVQNPEQDFSVQAAHQSDPAGLSKFRALMSAK